MRLVSSRVQTGEQYASGATFPERAAQPLSARASLPLAGWYIAIGRSGALPPHGLRPIIALGQVGRGDLRECVVPFSWAQGVADHACKRIWCATPLVRLDAPGPYTRRRLGVAIGSARFHWYLVYTDYSGQHGGPRV